MSSKVISSRITYTGNRLETGKPSLNATATRKEALSKRVPRDEHGNAFKKSPA
jgi:hypothetical protein